MKKHILEFIVTGFYLGKIPWMPGTFGTLLGIPTVWLLWNFGPMGFMGGSLLLIFAAIFLVERHEVATAEHDSGQIVIDEVVGYVVAMTWLPFTWQAFVAAFAIFRFFDILKPFPIGYLDRKIPGGLGTVLDDVAAGLVTNIILQVMFTYTGWLGETLNATALG